MRQRVDAFLRERWREWNAANAAAVRAQTEKCVELVEVPTAEGVKMVHYGFVGATWQRTVEILASTGMPPRLLLPGKQQWLDVNEDDVRGLLQRVASDMVLRLRLLDVTAASADVVQDGQAWLRDWLARASTRGAAVRHAPIPTWITRVHGVVELEFASAACELPEEHWPRMYAWLLQYLTASAQQGTFQPLVVPVGAAALAAREGTAAWLVAHYGSLAHLATSWQLDVPSASALASLLPPTSCPTLDDFAACIASLATPLAPPPPSPPSRPPRDAPETWVCTTAQSSLFPAMYLGPAGQLSFNVSTE